MGSTQILSKEELLGKCNDILVNVNCHKEDGYLKLWANNKLVFDFKG